MLFYILRRLIAVVIMLVITSVATFLLFFAAPEDPARLTCGKNCTPSTIEGNRKALGYDKPLALQYGKFITGIFAGRDYPDDPALRAAAPQLVVHCPAPCLGYSRVANDTVLDIIKQGLPITASIALSGFVLWIISGVLGGIVAALTRGRWPDRLIV